MRKILASNISNMKRSLKKKERKKERKKEKKEKRVEKNNRGETVLNWLWTLRQAFWYSPLAFMATAGHWWPSHAGCWAPGKGGSLSSIIHGSELSFCSSS